MVRTSKPAPGVAHRPQIALVLFATGENEVLAVRGPVPRRLVGRLRSAREQRMCAVAVGRHLPDRWCAVFSLVDRKTDVFTIRGPCRRAQVSVNMNELTKLRSIATDRVEAFAAHENDLGSVGRPCGIMACSQAQASRLAARNRPEPRRHRIVAPRELANEKLRMSWRNGKKTG